MRWIVFLLLASPLALAQEAPPSTSDPAVKLPAGSNPMPTPNPPSTAVSLEPSSLSFPSPSPSPSPEPNPTTPVPSDRSRPSGVFCERDEQCLNGICEIYPPSGSRICLDGGGREVGRPCDIGRQCLTGICSASDTNPGALECVEGGAGGAPPTDPLEPEVPPTDSLKPEVPEPLETRLPTPRPSGDPPRWIGDDLIESSEPSSPTNPPLGPPSATTSSAVPTSRPSVPDPVINQDDASAYPSITEVITSVSNGQSIRVTRTRAGASPSGRVVRPTNGASTLRSSAWLLFGVVIALL